MAKLIFKKNEESFTYSVMDYFQLVKYRRRCKIEPARTQTSPKSKSLLEIVGRLQVVIPVKNYAKITFIIQLYIHLNFCYENTHPDLDEM